MKSNIKIIVVLAAASMAFGFLPLTSCEKSIEGCNGNELNTSPKSTERYVYGIFDHTVGAPQLGIALEEVATQIEKYAYSELGNDIVLEMLDIACTNPKEAMLHLSYFDITNDISVNQWIDLECEAKGDTLVYYTDKPGPGLWNVSKYTCTGKCSQMCKITTEKEGDIKIKKCTPCPDEMEDRACIGETSNVDVLTYVVNLIAKLSPFKDIFSKAS